MIRLEIIFFARWFFGFPNAVRKLSFSECAGFQNIEFLDMGKVIVLQPVFLSIIATYKGSLCVNSEVH